jgi:DNA replication protein DnaC
MTFNHPSSNTVHGIPRSHWHCHLHNYEEPKDRVVEAVSAFLDEWKAGTVPAPHLLLTGKQGRGKTHLAVGIYRSAVYETNIQECAYIHVPNFCVRVKKSYGGGEDPFQETEEASLVVLDDIFGADLTEHEITKILTRLITTAYDRNQALVVTSNYSVKGISDILHPHELSRLLQNSTVLNMASERDHRLK